MSAEWKVHDLEVGKSYMSTRHGGIITYKGVDHYMGQTTLKFYARAQGEIYIWPHELATDLDPKCAPNSTVAQPPGPDAPAIAHFVEAGRRLAANPDLSKSLAIFIDYWGLDCYTPPPDTMNAVCDIVRALLILGQESNAASNSSQEPTHDQ